MTQHHEVDDAMARGFGLGMNIVAGPTVSRFDTEAKQAIYFQQREQ
jgi:hypothetical protein